MINTSSSCNKNHADLKSLLERFDARLVNVRFSPAEIPIKWSKSYLQLLLKNYQHLPALGLRETMPGLVIQNLTL